MRTKTKIVISVIIASLAIPLAIYTISPLLFNTVVNEPDPTLALSEFQKYMNLTEEERIQAARNMTTEQAMMIGIMAAKHNTTVDENVTYHMGQQSANNILTGTFIGIGDGFHKVEGMAKVIRLGSEDQILRLEVLRQPMDLISMSTYQKTNQHQISLILEDLREM